MPVALDLQVDRLLHGASHPAVPGPLVAAVVPHAGYVFSGPCAASVYSLISSGQYERVIILAPSHHVLLRGVLLPEPGLTAYATPLGNVVIDRSVCDAWREKDGFLSITGAEAREHAVEVHLPFLQKTARTFKLVPLVCGRLDAAQISRLAKVLSGCLDSNTLLIASSDFTHYGPHYDFLPFSEEVPQRLRAWLGTAGERIATLDAKGFAEHCRTTGDTICGEMPIRILMEALRLSERPVNGRVLNTATSGDVVGNYDNSVSYAAIGFFSRGEDPKECERVSAKERSKEGTIMKEHRSGEWTPGLTAAEKKTLFAIARDTLGWCVAGEKDPFSFDAYDLTTLMKTATATFVTLKIRGELRGCIGSLAPVEPLFRSVHNNTINAALRDPRFLPVRADELPLISIDVSILSPIRDIPSYKDFKIGQQGIIMEKGNHRAVYLPEVATEQGWTVEETLTSLSLKAGLDPQAWREGARFKVFESAVLSE
jgi:AmmeMemoRadiSam system protein B/AmmeMemoRadiSam system protein A